uniref:Motilin/ghrelin domain-containing protein n=1 Tax=Callithrix jacchus TaxID=9483 RepID=F6UVV2_CALJA
MAAPARVSTSFENPGAPTEGPQSCGQRLMGSKASSQGCEVYNSPSDQPQHQKTSRERLLQTHFDPCTPSRMVSRKTVAALLVVHTAAMLATQTEAFVPIFTYGELQKMQERERNKGQKKSLSIWQRSGEEGPADPTEPIEEEENKMIEVSKQWGWWREAQSRHAFPCLARRQGPQATVSDRMSQDAAVNKASILTGRDRLQKLKEINQPFRHQIRK